MADRRAPHVRTLLLLAGITACACDGAAGNATASVRARDLSVRKIGKQIYFQNGKTRYRLEGTEETPVSGPGGWKLTTDPHGYALPAIRLLRNGREVAKVRLEKLRDEWLERVDPWGSEERTTYMREAHEKRWGVTAFLHEASPTPSGWLGVLKWRAEAPSGSPIIGQHLVRVEASTPLIIRPVRQLHGAVRPPYSEIEPRLFPYRGKMLVWEPGELAECSPTGKRLRIYVKLRPKAVPARFLAGRWVVTVDSTAGEYPAGTRIEVVDLQTRATRTLFQQAPPKTGMRNTQIDSVCDAPPTLLLSHTSDSGPPKRTLVSVSTGRSRVVPLRPSVSPDLALGCLIVRENADLVAYDLRTLKPIKRMRVPAIR